MGMLARLSQSLFGGAGAQGGSGERRSSETDNQSSNNHSVTVRMSESSSPEKQSECVLDQLESYWREQGDYIQNGSSPIKEMMMGSGSGGRGDSGFGSARAASGLGIMASQQYTQHHL